PRLPPARSGTRPLLLPVVPLTLSGEADTTRAAAHRGRSVKPLVNGGPCGHLRGCTEKLRTRNTRQSGRTLAPPTIHRGGTVMRMAGSERLGDVLRGYRRRAGLTQQEAA